MPEEQQQQQQQQRSSILPPGVTPLVMEQFGGMNTLAARVSVPDKQVYFLDGFMPVAPGRLAALFDVGASLFVVARGVITKLFSTPNAILAWNNSGDLFKYDFNTTVTTQIAVSTFGSGVPTSIAACVIPGTFDVIIVQDAPNGYYILIGVSLYGVGNTAPGYGVIPAGVQGHAVELYSGHVWVANNQVILASAPGSYVDFSTSDGGVEFVSPDSFLVGSYTVLKSSGGFLYCFGDSSVSYISGVQTAGSPPTTTFTYQNADSTIGVSNWNDGVISTGRDLLFGNPTGIYRLRGGAATKVSYELDGFYNSSLDLSTLTPMMAQTVLNGRRVWMLLASVVDPIGHNRANRLLIWNGEEWFSTLQSIAINFIITHETVSIFRVFGANGPHCYPILENPSTSLTKTVQSKFWTMPEGYIATKAASRFWALGNWFSGANPDLTVTIENENASQNQIYTVAGPVGAGGNGQYFATVPEAIGTQGNLIGMTISTTCTVVELNSAMIGAEVVQYRG
jgi:hypothetical protein